MGRKKKPPPPPPPAEEDPLVRVNIYCPEDLVDWLHEDWQKKRGELEKDYGPAASRDYTLSKHVVGVLHAARRGAP